MLMCTSNGCAITTIIRNDQLLGSMTRTGESLLKGMAT